MIDKYRPAVALAVLAGATIVAAGSASSSAAATARRTLTVYAVATSAQFVDHSDDRARGANTNPFNADTKAIAAAAQKKEKKGGPYPGDDALYAFKLYAAADLKKSIGTATYTCVYNFDKQALCEATFDLNKGSLFASGPADFGSATFTLAVTGGTNGYLGLRGQVASAVPVKPVSKDEHRLDFTFG